MRWYVCCADIIAYTVKAVVYIGKGQELFHIRGACRTRNFIT